MDYKNTFNTTNLLNKLSSTYHQFFDATEVVPDLELNDQFRDLFTNAKQLRQQVQITLNDQTMKSGIVKFVDQSKIVLDNDETKQIEFILFQNIFEAEVL